MLFYPNVRAIITPHQKGGYCIYKKQLILDHLRLTSEAFTALGILSSNDYDPDPFLPEDEDTLANGTDLYRQCLEEKCKVLRSLPNPKAYSTNYRPWNTRTLNKRGKSWHSRPGPKNESTILDVADTAQMIRAYVESFLEVMNRRTGKEISFEAYKNSFKIFALQQETTIQYPDEDKRLLKSPKAFTNLIKDLE